MAGVIHMYSQQLTFAIGEFYDIQIVVTGSVRVSPKPDFSFRIDGPPVYIYLGFALTISDFNRLFGLFSFC